MTVPFFGTFYYYGTAQAQHSFAHARIIIN